MLRVSLFLLLATVVAGAAIPQSPAAPAKIAARPAGTRPVQEIRPSRVGVLRFSGPAIWDLDADEFWKIKNHTGEPTEGDLATVPDVLQKALTTQLVSRLGGVVVSLEELQRAQNVLAPSVNSSDRLSSLAKKLGLRYVLTGAIERLEFDGNTATPDDYILIVSVRLVDTGTGQTVWSEESRKFKSEIYTKSSGKSVLGMFSNRHIPEMAEALASDVAGALGR